MTMRARLLLPAALLILAACGDDRVVRPDPPVLPDPTVPPVTLARWGSHGSGAGQFYQPTALAAGPDGSVFVIDNQNRRVQKFSNDGDFLLEWGGDPGGPVAFSYLLTGIAAHGDRVYVSDIGTAATYVFTSEGVHLDTWDFLSVASGLAVFPDGDVLLSGFQVLSRGFIVDLLGPYVWRLDPEGRVVSRLSLPVNQVTVDREGNLYGLAVKYLNAYPRGFVFKFSPEGRVLERFQITTESTIYDAVAVDSRGYVYVANRPDGSILKYAPDGEFLFRWSWVTDLEVDLGWPAGLALDAADHLFVSDLEQDRVVKYGSPDPDP